MKKLTSLLSRDQQATGINVNDLNNVSFRGLSLCEVTKNDYLNMNAFGDSFLDSGATVTSTVKTIAFGERYCCRFREPNGKRIIFYSPIYINNVYLQALVDTGATISAIQPIYLLRVYLLFIEDSLLFLFKSSCRLRNKISTV